ncbi:MAG: hypothetical protein ACLFR7_10975 [Opitutales bacterium]
MRLTVNLEEPFYRAAKAISKAKDVSLSAAVNKLIAVGFERRNLAQTRTMEEARQPFPSSRGRRSIDAAAVALLEDELEG